jgi:DnaJ-class molecular chaperone
MNLSFQDAARGATKEVTLNVVDTCPTCLGKKTAPGYKPVTCPFCNGSGMVHVYWLYR